MKIKNVKYFVLCIFLLLFLIGASSATEDFSDYSNSYADSTALDSVIDDLDSPLTNMVSEDDSDTFTDTASIDINANTSQEVNNDVKQKDSSVKNTLNNGASTTIYVSNSGSDTNTGLTPTAPVATIAKAIDLANTIGGSADFTISVANGNYDISQITSPSSKNINLVGENLEETIFHISGPYGIWIYASNVKWNIENITFCDMNNTESTSAALKISTNDKTTINNCVFKNIGSCQGAIYIASSDKTSISNIIIEDCFGTVKEKSAIIDIADRGPVILDNVEIRGSYMMPPALPWDRPYLVSIIYLESQDSNATLMNSRIIDNNGAIASIIESRGKIKVINSNITNNKIDSSNFGADYMFYSGPIYSSSSSINISQSLIADNILAKKGSSSGLFCILNGSHNIDHSVIMNNEYADGSNAPLVGSDSVDSISADNNYWGTNEKPNNKTDKWVILTADVPNYAFVGITEHIPIYLNTYMTTSGEIGSIEDIATVDLGVNYILNQENPSVVTIANGQGTIDYLASSTGDEILTLSNGNTFEIEVNDDISTLIYVDGSVETSGDGRSESPLKTIAEALNITSDGKIILIRNGTYNEKDLVIDDNITIKADRNENVIIDAENQGRIFTVTSSATLRDLTLIGGQTDEKGGGIYVNNTNSNDEITLTAYNLKIIGCEATSGGGIYTEEDCKLNISNTILKNNFASYGSAIYINHLSDITICDFINNTQSPNDETIFVNGTYASISSNNFESDEEYAANYICATNSELSLSGNRMTNGYIFIGPNSLINSNLIFLNGNTISSEAGKSINLTATLNDDKGNPIKGGSVTFTANGETVGTVDLAANGEYELAVEYTVPENAVDDIIISGSYNRASDEGITVNATIHPAIPHWFIEGGNGYEYLSDAIDHANSGDVIYGIPGTYIVNDIFIQKDITIKANEAGSIILDGDKSRIFTITDSATLTLINLDLSNGSNGWGGFIYIYAAGGNLNLINSTLRDLRNTISSYDGAAIKTLANSIINIEGSHFENISSAGDAAILSADYQHSRPTVSIKDSSFTNINCSASYTLMKVAGNLHIERSNFTDILGNINKDQGSIGSTEASNYYISECQFINITGPRGSAIYFPNGNLTVTKSLFIDNKNAYGTIYLQNPNSANINYNLFIDNECTSSSNAKDIFINMGNNVNASYNYFGSNDKPTASQISYPDNASLWTIVDLSCSDDPVYIGTTAEIGIKFMGTDGTDKFALEDTMPKYEFNLLLSDGGLEPSSIIIIDNEATATFSPPSMVGTVIIKTTPGDAELEINVMDTSKLLVVSTEGNNANPGTLESPYNTIEYALSQANETRNIIYLLDTGENYNEYNLIVSGNIIIMGENKNVTIDAEGNGRIFTVIDNLSIKDLSLTGGDIEGLGGAIYLDGGNLTLNNVKISDSKAEKGGAIASTAGSNLTINNTELNNNKALNGGATYISGEALVLNSKFNGNLAEIPNENSYGGAIYINTSSPITVSSNIFENNNANIGEAIYIENGNVNLSKNKMPANESIYLTGGNVKTHLIFLNNNTVKAELGETISLNASLTDDEGNRIRGGIITFTANNETIGTADLSNIDEIAIPYTIPDEADGDIVISGSYSLDNGGTVSNGKIHPTIPYWFIEGGNGYEYLADAIAAAENGDIIYGIPGTYTVNGIQILYDITIKANETGSIILDGNKTQMFRTSANVNLINLTLTNGGTSGGGFAIVNGGTLNLINSTIRDLRSSGQGAAITVSSQSKLNIEKSHFENISSSSSAAILTATGASTAISIKDSSFENINCTNDYTLMKIESSLSLERSNFTNIVGKYQSNWYGAIGLTSSANASISECQFINITGGDGSAIYFNSKGDLNLSKSLFINNKNCRGSVYLGNNPSATNINYNIFIDNQASSASASKDVYIASANNVNADYNFWGSNSQPTADEITRASDASKWTIVELSKFSDTMYMGTVSDINLRFVGTDGEKNFTLEEYMPEYSFDLSATDGIISPDYLILKDNEASISYTPPSEEGSVTITASPGPAELVIYVKNPSELLVVSTDGSNDNPGTLDSPYATIAYALSQVTETRNIIYLLSKNEIYEESGLIISGNVTIRGEDNSIILKAPNAERIFNVTGNATIRDLILIEGNASYGGAIYVDGGSLTLDNAIISRCNASYGGAIYINTTSDVNIISTVFEDNIGDNGDGIYLENGALTLSGNDFSGEIVYLTGGSVNSKLVFLSNRTVNAEFGSEITLSASLTDDNGNLIRGGSVTFTANGETVGTIDLSENNPLEVNFTVPADASEDIVISGSYNLDNGGIIATGTIHPCAFNWIIEGKGGYETLDESLADAQDGDIIYGLPGTYTVRELELNKAISIKANESGSIILDGNGSQIFHVRSNAQLINLTLTNGKTNGNGGLVYVNGSTLTVRNTTFKDTVMETSSNTRGGAIYSTGSLYIYDSLFEGLKAKQGAAIYEQSPEGRISIDNSIFNNINSTYDGGMINSNIETSIARSKFTNIIGVNTTGEYGNIYCSGERLTIEECDFINIFGPGGAAVFYSNYYGVLNITKSIFENINCTTKGVIYSTGETHINYNVFRDVNEGINISSNNLGNGTIDYNYWGTNENPSSIMTTYSPNNWIIMNAELNETNLVGKKNVKIIVDFNHYIENGEIKELEDSITREFTVKFTSTTGELDVEERNTTDQVTYAVYSAVIGENNITINSAKSEVELTFITSEPLEDHISIEMDDEDKLVVTLTDGEGFGLEGKTIEVLIGDNTLTGTTDAEGKAVISLDEVEDGAYTASIIFNDPIYEDIEEKTFIIIKSNEVPVPEPVAANITIGLSIEDGKVTATVTDLEGTPLPDKALDVSINGATILDAKTDKNGIWTIEITANSTIVVSCIDENGAEASASIEYIENNNTEIVPVEVPVIANATLDVVTGDGAIIVTVKDFDGAPIANATVATIINGKEQNITADENGLITIPVEGNATVELSYTDANGASVSASVKLVESIKEIEVPVEVPAPVANATIGLETEDGSSVTVTVKDLDGNAIANAPITATVNGAEQNMTADKDGKAVIALKGNSTVEVKYTDPLNNATASSSMSVTVIENLVEKIIEVIPNRTATIIEYKNMTTKSVVVGVDGRIGEYFYATLKDINGKPLANKSMGIGFNGKIYPKTTDENGRIKLQINLKVAGKYTFAIAFLGDDNYTGSFEVALITVTAQTPKLTAPAKTYKASAKTKTLTATLKTAHGNVVKGKVISFTVNGKTYKGTTNAKGVASVKVSLSKKGTYSCTAKYAGDDVLKATSRKFNVKIV